MPEGHLYSCLRACLTYYLDIFLKAKHREEHGIHKFSYSLLSFLRFDPRRKARQVMVYRVPDIPTK